jgi:hypothetical protein
VKEIKAEQVASAAPKKRGRKTNAEKEAAARLAASGAPPIQENGNPSLFTAASSPQPNAGAAAALPQLSEINDIPKEAIVGYLEMPFAYAARRTGFEGFKLGKDSADKTADQAIPVIKQYAPWLNSPHAPLFFLCATLLGITGMKYVAYVEWRDDQAKQQTEKKV